MWAGEDEEEKEKEIKKRKKIIEKKREEKKKNKEKTKIKGVNLGTDRLMKDKIFLMSLAEGGALGQYLLNWTLNWSY